MIKTNLYVHIGTSKTPRPSSLSPQKRITHPRFVGKSDHEVRILEQTTPTAAASHYTCHICGFESSRLNVIVLHNRSHSNGTYVSPAKPQKTKKHTVPKKGKKPKSFATTSSIDEDLELIRQGVTLTVGDSTDTESSDKEPHTKSAKRKNNKGASNASKKAKVSTSICNNLLADWGDSDSNEESATTTADKPTASEPTEPKEDARTDTSSASMNKSVHNELLADWDDKNSDDEPGGTPAPEKQADDVNATGAGGEKVSCFDFDEEVEHAAAAATVLQKSPGRKIPRVIPQKRISQDADDSMETDQPLTTKPDADKSETEESRGDGNSTEEEGSMLQDNSEDKSKKDNELDMEAFKSILDETAVPELPTIQDISKSREKSFDDSSSILEKTNGVLKSSDIELPSTSDTNESTSEKLSETPVTSLKKRIVRNFEEFENLLNEQSKTEDESSSAGESSVEVSKLKSQLMSKLTESPAKQQPPVVTTTDAETESETNEPEDEEEEERVDLSQEAEKKKKQLRTDSEDSDIDDEERKTDTPKDKVQEKDDAVQKKDEVDEEAEMPEEQEQEDIINDVATESAESTMDINVETSEEKIEETTVVEEEEPASESMETSLIQAPLHTPIEDTEENVSNTFVASSSEAVEENTPVESFEETILEEIPETTTIVESVPEEKLSEEKLPEEKLPEDKHEETVVNEYPTEDVSEIVENVPEITEEIKDQQQVEEIIEETTAIIEETVPEVQETITEEEQVVEKIAQEEERVEDIPLPPTQVEEIQEFPPHEEQTFHQEEQIAVEKEKEEEPSFVEETITTTTIAATAHPQEMSEESRSQKMLVDISDICIDNTDHLSGLTTLAAVSELTGNLYDKPEPICQPSPSLPAETKEQETVNNESTVVPACTVSEEIETTEMVPMHQEEIIQEMPAAAAAEQQHEKPVRTLANFSMDFSDSNSESAVIKPAEEDAVSDKIPELVDTQEIPVQEEILEPIQTVEATSIVTTEIPNDFESIESEIEKITSIETHSDKLNSFPENISHPTDTIDNTTITYPDFTLSEASTTITTTISHEFGTQPIEEQVVHTETTLESEIAKLTDTHPDTENVVQEQQQNTTSSKLLEILTDSKNVSKKGEALKADSPNTAAAPPTRTVISAGSSQKVHMVITGDSKSISKKFDPKTSKFVIKSATSKAHGKSNKPIILSEKIIKPVTETENVSVKKVTSKRSYQDVEDIDTFIIQKPNKKANTGESMDQQDIILTPKTDTLKFKSGMRSRGKPKIIEQTIIKAADVVQPVSVQVSVGESQQLLDDSMFDINSMPIVLSDQILTPESIENMPVVMTDLMPSSTATVQTVITEKPQQTIAVKRGGTLQQVKLLNKSKISTGQQPAESPGKMGQNVVVKNIMPRGLGKNQKVYQTGGTKLKNNPAVITTPGKPGRFIILPSSTTTTSGGSKYTVGKRLSTVKSVTSVSSSPTTSKMKGLPSSTVEPTGNKIMIVTNQQGVQSRVLLTPAQQKLLGCKMPTTKLAKSPSQHMKGGVMQKSILTSKGTILAPVNSSGGGLIPSQKSSSLASQTIVTSKGQLFTTGGQTLVTSEGQVLTPITQQQLKTLKSEQHKVGKKLQIQSSRVILPDKGESSQKGKMNLAAGAKTKTILIKGTQGQTLKKIQTPINETKNIAMSSQASHKTSPLISISSSQMSGKQVMLTSKGQLIKQDMKVGGMAKQYGDKLQRVQSPKASLGGQSQQHRIVTKSPRAQMMIGKQHLASSAAVPPLAPITASQSKKDAHAAQQIIKQNEQKLAAALIENKEIELADKAALEQKQPNQLIIQDTLGNQTTVTEGQILALPSETIDGQPQSYVLVTVDETGNLVPISNDTLMSLDPSLAAGGDMSNIVLQIDQGAQETQPAEIKTTLPPATSTELPVDNQQFAVMNQQQQQQQPAVETATEHQQMITMDNQQLLLPEQNILTSTAGAEQQMIVTDNQQVFMDKEPETFVTNTEETQVITSDPSTMIQDNQTAVACSINSGDTSQQLIITGDPESTQKFLASLSEGNTDLSSLLSSTDGNIIINTDGQQILLNPDSDNQILLSVNSDNLGLIQTTAEGDAAAAQNAMYVTQQAMKNQDILAAALADTDVFQQESAVEKGTSQALTKVSSSSQSQLSPNSNLYPMNVGNVLETSLTLGSPIMTPLEVPSVNNKKINTDVESTLISRVRSSLELPITITDPSITQTVSQQVMLSNDLQTNLELPITMSDAGITSIRSSEMSSPSFVYSLPTLDDHSDLEQKRVFTETSSTVITSDNLYNTTLTGSMSMPLLTEEPEIATVEAEQTNASAEDAPTVSTASETTVTSEIIGTDHDDHQSTNYPVVSVGESLQPSMSEKMSSDLQIGAIEEELDLNATDICSSLSEPPPGMFDNIVNPRYLSNKPEQEESVADIPLPPQDTTTTTTTAPSIAETTNSTNENTSLLNEPISSSLPMLSDGTENETGNSDMTTNSSGVTEKSPAESNLDMDYGVSESSDQHSLSETAVNQDVPRSEMSETPNSSDLNSPRLDIDEEASTEIPIQPPIITNLGDSFENNTPTTADEEFTLHPAADESRKRASEDREEDMEEDDAKRTKLSCD